MIIKLLFYSIFLFQIEGHSQKINEVNRGDHASKKMEKKSNHSQKQLSTGKALDPLADEPSRARKMHRHKKG